MAELAFVKGDNVSIQLDGKVLGCVRKLVCTRDNSFIDIESFLTDVPVYRIAEKKYKIVLSMDCEPDNPFFDGESFEQLEIKTEEKCERYTDCTVNSVKTEVNPKGVVEISVELSAEEREVL